MTSSITPVRTVSDGGDTTTKPERERPRAGLPALREREAHSLISLGLDALSEASKLGHDIHTVIYDANTSTDTYPELQQQLAEVLACLETAEHYLAMLGSVFEDTSIGNRPLVAVPSQ
jgi:hypothetical protein